MLMAEQEVYKKMKSNNKKGSLRTMNHKHIKYHYILFNNEQNGTYQMSFCYFNRRTLKSESAEVIDLETGPYY